LTEKPRFTLRLWLSGIGEIEAPNAIDAKTVIEAWHLLNGFLMDFVDKQGIEPTDEQFREMLLELLYRLIYREMSVLQLMPIWEREFKDQLEKGKRIQRLPRQKGDV